MADLTNKVAQTSEKVYDFLLGRIYFTGDNGYQNFLVFTQILSLLILNSNKKVTNWISTGISFLKIKPFDTNIDPAMSNLTNVE